MSLDDGDEVIQVMLIPDKPNKNEFVVHVTAAGFASRQPIARLMEHTGDTDDMAPFRCMAIQVNKVHGRADGLGMAILVNYA